MPTEHRVPVTDTDRISAIKHPAPTANWLVFCHGFISDKTGSYEERCERAVDEGFNAIRFDFRGCGESDGAFTDQTLTTRLHDLHAVTEYFDLETYAVFGSSFGGKVAFHAAIEDPRITAIATRAPVTYNETFDPLRSDVAESGWYEYDTGHRIDHRFFDDLDNYPFSDVTTHLDRPVAIVHGANDASVDPAYSFRAAGKLDTDVMVHKYPNEGHRFSRNAEARLRDELFAWLTTTP